MEAGQKASAAPCWWEYKNMLFDFRILVLVLAPIHCETLLNNYNSLDLNLLTCTISLLVSLNDIICDSKEPRFSEHLKKKDKEIMHSPEVL